MSRSVKKGPYVEAKLFARIEELNKANEKKVLRTWSRASRNGGAHDCRVRRQKARSRLYHRRYGRLQVGRICPDENVQRSYGEDDVAWEIRRIKDGK